ncbi:cytochrome c biogenesis protein CcsA [Tamlana sp. 2_MG-2023]|uniref:cytochrome c biogenesis protein n=1 Tax=unclassified Tamlana TaxID=2614803 RepID=UPI0026E148AA|nr:MULTISPECIES: cytochrome c biogenesis protein CcsA [unclassified Tamlana]MDO6759196.1 cytochrome c biogenesis protein CcsA [Tamlana sp. 2_MG-2023]MDO6790665.1 cytochrome c biogenesis protein CcsA [Tamlana sp. 1_MG-2023]
MQKKLANIFFSTKLTAVLFIVFAATMAVGTFLDAGQETSPTPYTRNLIYNAWWFEAIMVFFIINFIGNVFRYRLYKKEKWATFILHVSFIFILLGAFITRYASFEGMMAIREGATENTFLSAKTYVTAYIDGDYEVDGVPQRLATEREVDFSGRMENHFEIDTKYNQQPVKIELENFIVGAEEDIIPSENGEEYLKIVEAGSNGPHNHFLKVGEVQSVHGILLALNKPTDGAINITYKNDELTINSPFEGEYMTMATMAQGKLVKDSLQPLILRSRYVIGNMQMVFPKPVVKGEFDLVEGSALLKNSATDGVKLRVTSNGESKTVGVLGNKGSSGTFKQINVGGLDIALKYGSKVLELPFSIKLNDFEAERYPGTERGYSAYSSEVTVIDETQDDYDYKIYMNNILDHGGYRFFQSSFDPDEKGTILSVNHDYWGTLITYIGYFMLYFGMLAILFSKHSRFGDLRRQLEKVKAKKAKLLTVLVLCFGLTAVAQDHGHGEHSADDGHNHSKPTKEQIDSILHKNITPKEHASKFGNLVIQDLSGRMMPVNTYASEMLRKLSKSDTYEDFDANQVFLSIQESPMLWYNVPIIYLKPQKGDSIRHLIGAPKEAKYVALADFFSERGEYRLAPFLDEAYKAQVPNGFQKEFKETDQRVSLLYNAIEGMSLKIFPIPDDANNKWISNYDYTQDITVINDELYNNFVKNGFRTYLMTLNQAKKTGDYKEAEKLLTAFKKTQHRYGGEVMLSDDKIKTEVLYNKYDIFKKLFSWYLYAGTFMFILLIVQIFNEKRKGVNLGVNIFKYIIFALFLLHTAGLIVRWYISGHAPWSDAYESMIYVAWATMLFGIIFGRKSDLTIASTAFVTSMILMIAHWNWMDPAIANLQPVLNSYWLMIHVAVIVASYGPFTLGMILGIVSLFLMIFTNKSNKVKMDLNIKELTVITEMALTVGLVMLTIGNFLGGMWANESWGRYWGWDPKETWALISIMIYAFVIHMRLVPGLRGRWIFNLLSIVAFASIIMTYFGVNFYLAGLHSYASGDQIVSVKFIAIACVLVAILGFFSYRGYAKYYKK